MKTLRSIARIVSDNYLLDVFTVKYLCKTLSNMINRIIVKFVIRLTTPKVVFTKHGFFKCWHKYLVVIASVARPSSFRQRLLRLLRLALRVLAMTRYKIYLKSPGVECQLLVLKTCLMFLFFGLNLFQITFCKHFLNLLRKKDRTAF